MHHITSYKKMKRRISKTLPRHFKVNWNQEEKKKEKKLKVVICVG